MIVFACYIYVCWTPDVIPDLIGHLIEYLTGYILCCVLSTLLFIYLFMSFLLPVYTIIICSYLYSCASFQFILTHSLGVLTPWICISRFVAIYCWSDFFGEDQRYLEELEFFLTRSSFFGIFFLFFILSLSWFYVLDSCLFHFPSICHHVWIFICDVAMILIYYSDYIACSGHLRLSAYIWGIFLTYMRRWLSSRLRSNIF